MELTQITRLKELQDRLANIPVAMETTLQERRVQEQNQSDKESDMKSIEITVRQQVSDETVDGKKLYSNQQQRDDETTKRLSDHPIYRRERAEFAAVSGKLKELLDTIEVLKIKFRATEKIVDIELAMSE